MATSILEALNVRVVGFGDKILVLAHGSGTDQSTTTRRSLKRKLKQDFLEDKQDRRVQVSDSDETPQDLASDIHSQLEVLNSTFSSLEANRASAKRAAHFLFQLAKNEDIVDVIVECGVVPALVKHLQAAPLVRGEIGTKPYEHDLFLDEESTGLMTPASSSS